MFTERRAQALARMGEGTVALFPSARVALRNNDVEHEFRPDSDVHYLTGFGEPDGVLLLSTAHAAHHSVLFVRPRDPERERWDGVRAGVDAAPARFGVDAAYPLDALDDTLVEYFTGARELYFALGRDRALDDRVLGALRRARAKARKGGLWPASITEPARVVHELRWRKSPAEVALLERAAACTRAGFHALFSQARAGASERQLEGALRAGFLSLGAERVAYLPIVASGPNACVLHHRSGPRVAQPGELVLVDAGAEFGCYASDVTRTIPVDGRFSPPQRAVYELVLAAQREAIAAVRPGATLEQVHQRAVAVLTEGMVRLGLLQGEPDELVKSEAYKRYYMHGTSHWLGMDVHDVGPYYVDGAARPLEPGAVLTVEPGLYVSDDDASAPAEYRGLGVRIEDDVLVTDDAAGSRVLTHAIAREVDELEALLLAGR